VRHGHVDGDKVVKLFQSTHPRGVRQNKSLIKISEKSFNPRTRAGCDYYTWIDANGFDFVSIHAPARGATP